MLKVFTIKFEDKLESFNDSILADFLADKDIVRWDSMFFERRSYHFWTVIVEYEPRTPTGTSISKDSEKKQDEGYKEILTQGDWPLFERLRQWRGEKSKSEGLPPYIVLTNMQLAKIAVTKPASLNALQEIEGIGNAKREKYGKDILEVIGSFGTDKNEKKEDGDNGR